MDHNRPGAQDVDFLYFWGFSTELWHGGTCPHVGVKRVVENPLPSCCRPTPTPAHPPLLSTCTQGSHLPGYSPPSPPQYSPPSCDRNTSPDITNTGVLMFPFQTRHPDLFLPLSSSWPRMTHRILKLLCTVPRGSRHSNILDQIHHSSGDILPRTVISTCKGDEP